MKTVLIIGATRNLGKYLAQLYAAQPNTTVYATARYAKPHHHAANIHWVGNVDLTHENAGAHVTLNYNNEFPIDIVIFVGTSSSSLFSPETLEHANFEREVKMYKTTAIGPVFVLQHLMKNNILRSGSKIIFIGNEAGSIGLRCEGSEGGNFGHHGSNAALNIISRLLSLELQPKGIVVGVVHPGLIRSEGESLSGTSNPKLEMITPAVAAESLAKFIEEFDIDRTGTFWAVRGAKGMPTAEKLLGPVEQLPVPLQLPW